MILAACSSDPLPDGPGADVGPDVSVADDTNVPVNDSGPGGDAAAPDASNPSDTSDAGDTEDAAQGDTSNGTDPYEGLSDGALLDALRADAIAAMTALGYTAGRDAMYAVGGVDDNDGRIEGIYTGRTVDTDGSRVPADNCALIDGTPVNCSFNTEHVFAQKHLRDAFGEGSATFNKAQGDIHHLYPSYANANQKRGNYDFGNTDCAQNNRCAFDEESQLGTPTGVSSNNSCSSGTGSGCRWMVRPVRRGDIARSIFYMTMHYDLDLPADVEQDLRGWHAADPPDAWEQRRNDRVEAAQGNRNPFIDRPELVDRIARF